MDTNQLVNDIAKLAVSQEANRILDSTKRTGIVIPKDYQLQTLEHLQAAPDQFRGTYHTTITSEFTDYVNKNGGAFTGVFIDQDDMVAQAIIDMGSHDAPQWGRHKAVLKLKKTPAYQMLLSLRGNKLDQQSFIDFLEDNQEHIQLYQDDPDNAIALKAGIKALRSMKISANSTSEQTIENYSASLSAMESVEIKSAQNSQPPTGFRFHVAPYEGFVSTIFNCQLRAVSDDKKVSLIYRIIQLDKHIEDIANYLRHTIKGGIDNKDIAIFLGEMSYQQVLK